MFLFEEICHSEGAFANVDHHDDGAYCDDALVFRLLECFQLTSDVLVPVAPKTIIFNNALRALFEVRRRFERLTLRSSHRCM